MRADAAKSSNSTSETRWLPELCRAVQTGQCVDMRQPVPWGRGIALALAPHPDDPEAVAVTLRRLVESGWHMRWTIVTSGWSGVLEDFAGPGPTAKAAVRKKEQQVAARLFGLPSDCLSFLELEETDQGALAQTEPNRARLFAHLSEIAPDIVLLPWQMDSNETHRLVYRWFAEWADTWPAPVVALGNEDPKTLHFEPHLRVVFDEATAKWKERLLECHRSQSARNLKIRGHNFAERILGMNRRVPGIPTGFYAERFQVKCWRCGHRFDPEKPNLQPT